MSTHNKKVMSLEEKVRIIRMHKVVKHRGEKRGFKILYPQILKDKHKILAQYDDMKAKLAAVRDLVITEYGKPNFIGEKHAFLEKVICEWYQRAEALPEIKKVPLALVCHKTDIALRILNITDLPLSETQVCYLKSKCHKASVERISKFESTTLSIKKIAKELLVKMGISKATAISMYGPDIFEGPDDDEDDVGFLRRTHHARHKLGKRKLKQPEQLPPTTSNAKVGRLVEQDLTEVVPYQSETDSEDDDTDSDSDTKSAQAKEWPYESKVNEDNQSEEEDFELYDVISVGDSSEDFDAATSSTHILPDSLIKKECETFIDSGGERVAPLIKVEPDEGQCSTNVQEMVGECHIKCETTDDECGNIKIEIEGLEANCDSVTTTTYFQDCEKQEIEEEEANSDRDDDRLVHLYTVASDDSLDDDSASRSMENGGCVETYEDVRHRLALLKAYLQRQGNERALEALNKVEAAFPQSAKKSR